MVALITNGLNRMRTLRSFSYTPRWIVFLIDVALAIMAVSVAYLIWVNFQIDRMRLDFVLTGALVIVGIRVVSFLLGHTYSGIVRFTGNGGCFAHLLRVDGRGDCPSFGEWRVFLVV